VVFLENKVKAVIGLSELSLLVWIPIHGQELSMSGNGDQPRNLRHTGACQATVEKRNRIRTVRFTHACQDGADNSG
jgi:hypothetical protein